MALGKEIRKEIGRQTLGSTPVLEALAQGGEKDVTAKDLLQILINKANALEWAVYRLAQEVDKLTGSAEADG